MSSQSSDKFRDSSIFSYLDGVEETFVLELRSSKRDPAYLGKNRTTEDREIDVFDAKKYFNEGTNYTPIVDRNKGLPDHQSKNDEPIIQVLPAKDWDQIATPSVRSDSSWNSGSGMLHSVPRNQKPKKFKRKGFLANIGCNCSCSDKNSVEIGDFDRDNCSTKSGNILVKTSDLSVKKSPSEHDTRAKFLDSEMKEGHFSFPVFNSKTGDHAARTQIQAEQEDATKPKSLDVFGSPILEKGKNRLSLDKKLSMLTWDALVPGVTEEIKIPPICSDLNNDGDSDASSDLFEIESLSKGNSRQASDGLSGSVTPRNCYAPSEASIEWSVVTASAADFSIFSDFEELRSTTTTTTTTSTVSTTPNPQKPGLNPRNSALKELSKRRTGILSGCKSEKAVRVDGDAHKSHEKEISNTRNLLKSDTLAQSKVPGFEPRKRQQSLEHLLYT
ncbi:protein PHYTOCHROME KINASE SUBSTRATE 1-like [Primulina huaijiensis]|uniref:protein PHYTOCHROME KINASE SUBSTRATE 1-like n=1 Tax=Primulina huaijiensis TaxID=1492673 RepID=UPI003CC74807